MKKEPLLFMGMVASTASMKNSMGIESNFDKPLNYKTQINQALSCVG